MDEYFSPSSKYILFFLLLVVLSDVNSMYLSSTEPPAAAEWACLLRPLRGREPEGIWNLLSIVREMFKRRDSNAAPLLEILTEQCLTHEQVPNLTQPHFTPHDDSLCKKLHHPAANTCHICACIQAILFCILFYLKMKFKYLVVEC